MRRCLGCKIHVGAEGKGPSPAGLTVPVHQHLRQVNSIHYLALPMESHVVGASHPSSDGGFEAQRGDITCPSFPTEFCPAEAPCNTEPPLGVEQREAPVS